MIKTAARINQIKYQRATAIWRQYRNFIEAEREAVRMMMVAPLNNINQSQQVANLSRPEAIASSHWSSAPHGGQERFYGLAVSTRDQQNMVGISSPPNQSQSLLGLHAVNSLDVNASTMQIQWQQK